MNNIQPAGEGSEPQQPSPKYADCASCRIVGSATFATVGTYALWQSRAAAPGNPSQKRIVAGLGLALLAGSVMRWLK